MADEVQVREAVRLDRAVGAVLASAAGDALGAPHEFGPPLGPDVALALTGGGPFGWAPGEWTDDTQQAVGVLLPPSRGAGHLVEAAAEQLRDWYLAGPADVGNQTRAVLSAAGTTGSLAEAAAAYQRRHPDAAGNGSLMRTGPVALAAGGDPERTAELAAAISALTHPHPDAVDACVLWSVAIAVALGRPTAAAPDWVDLVAAGVGHLPADRRRLWLDRLDASRTTSPEAFGANGWVVRALQVALAAIAQTPVPSGAAPGRHLQLALERAVRAGGDTDTVAAIAGALLGAHWGATAVPHRWRRTLHGQVQAGEPDLRVADLDRLARLAVRGGRNDAAGWPDTPSLLPHYRATWSAPPLAVDLVDDVVVGNVHAVPEVVDDVEAVVSLCRMGRADVPAGVEHHVVGLLDSDPADNPNLDLLLADTADLVAELTGEGRRVFVHCVQAQNRTPAVAAAVLVRHHGVAPAEALDRAAAATGHRPTPFLAAAVERLADVP